MTILATLKNGIRRNLFKMFLACEQCFLIESLEIITCVRLLFYLSIQFKTFFGKKVSK